jgi:hypothetical protein
MELPPAILSIGGRYGYDDDGDTCEYANPLCGSEAGPDFI